MKAVKKSIPVLAFVIVSGIMAWLVYEISKPEILPVGSKIPVFSYLTKNGKQTFITDSSRMTIVMLFHPQCDLCKYMLDQFERFIGQFDSAEICFFTPHKQFFTQNNNSGLYSAENVNWGILSRKDVMSIFGTNAVPALYIFDRSGHLVYKRKGAIKLEKLLDENFQRK
ncbi:hypothetical protein JW935_04635 [candidate division KSB1 bacterium]|nr:hypothetical protein [candidate division KSB1 bacterium]